MSNLLVSLLVFLVLMELLVVLVLLARRFLQPRGPFKLTINESREVTVDAVDTLLNHLYAQRIFIPSSCGGQGTCGLCKVQVHKPRQACTPVEEEQIPPNQRAEGFRLACAVKVQSDMELRVPEEILDAHEQEATVVSNQVVAPEVTHLVLAVGEAFSFYPGQYLQIQIPVPDTERGFEFRAYSIASDPARKGVVELAIKRVPGGLGSNWLHARVAGDRLTFTGPYGEWRLDPDPGVGLLLVGGGVGLTPLRSLLYAVSLTCPEKRVHFYYGARTRQDLFWADEWPGFKSEHPHWTLTPVLSHEPADSSWEGARGFVHEEVDRSWEFEAVQVFLCGPPPMIEALDPVLKSKGVPADRIFADAF